MNYCSPSCKPARFTIRSVPEAVLWGYCGCFITYTSVEHEQMWWSVTWQKTQSIANRPSGKIYDSLFIFFKNSSLWIVGMILSKMAIWSTIKQSRSENFFRVEEGLSFRDLGKRNYSFCGVLCWRSYKLWVKTRTYITYCIKSFPYHIITYSKSLTSWLQFI